MKVLGIIALSCVLVPLVPAETRPSDARFVVQSHVPPAAGQAVYLAVLGARRRIEQPLCQRPFSEFSDASSRTLQENLDVLGQTGAAYLGLILFADGSDRRPCKAGGALAFTTPGSRVVYVCGREFKDLADRSPVRAQAIVIHEALHTLGLGENPPSSSEITARVLAGCQS
jgi:hypothetical protein